MKKTRPTNSTAKKQKSIKSRGSRAVKMGAKWSRGRQRLSAATSSPRGNKKRSRQRFRYLLGLSKPPPAPPTNKRLHIVPDGNSHITPNYRKPLYPMHENTPQYYGPKSAALLLNISRQHFHRLKERLPAADATIDGRPVWLENTLTSWWASMPRTRGRPLSSENKMKTAGSAETK